MDVLSLPKKRGELLPESLVAGAAAVVVLVDGTGAVPSV
jgi:hypothetical protein